MWDWKIVQVSKLDFEGLAVQLVGLADFRPIKTPPMELRLVNTGPTIKHSLNNGIERRNKKNRIKFGVRFQSAIS